MLLPKTTIDYIKSGHAILFLGAFVHAKTPDKNDFPYSYANAPPGGKQLSQHLVNKLAGEGKPYPVGQDIHNLQRVSLYFQTTMKSRKRLIEEVESYLTEYGSENKKLYKPSDALGMLAALPFSIFITTNYDDLFDQSLQKSYSLRGIQHQELIPKRPVIKVYKPGMKTSPDEVDLDPPEERPNFFKLHGDFNNPESIVITEEDYIDFIQKMGSKDFNPIPPQIVSRIKTWPVIFIGYSLQDYNLRILFKTLRWQGDPATFPTSISIDPKPDEVMVSVWEKRKDPMVNFVRKDLWDLVPQLFKEIIGMEYSEYKKLVKKLEYDEDNND